MPALNFSATVRSRKGAALASGFNRRHGNSAAGGVGRTGGANMRNVPMVARQGKLAVTEIARLTERPLFRVK